MQELRSTEILDNEILKDARTKVEKILNKADEECTELLEKVSGDIEKAKTQKEEFFKKKLETYEKDQKSSIPLEKQRFKVSFIQNSINSNIELYLKSLSEEKRLEIVTKKIEFISLPKEIKFRAYIYGFDFTQAKIFLSNKLGKNLFSCEETVFNKIVLEERLGLSNPQGIILESEDKTIRVRLSLSEVCEQLMNKNRNELADALFGGSL